MVLQLIGSNAALIDSANDLAPLPAALKRGLTAVCSLGFLSLTSSVLLLIYLICRLFVWHRRSEFRANQSVILIFNLILADTQQSIGLLLNVEWVRHDAVLVDSNICWSQGWFVSTGDLAAGFITLAIVIHAFADIVWDFRLSRSRFLLSLAGPWTFVYACATIGLALHPDDFYTRAGAWCWIDGAYGQERLWLHDIWVIIAEFCTLIIYALILIIVPCTRIRDNFHTTSGLRLRARSAARCILVYPVVHVVCSLPLIIARLKATTSVPVSPIELCVAGAMLTSAGWLDVLVYILMTSNHVPTGRGRTHPDPQGPGAFRHDHPSSSDNSNWRADHALGNTTTIHSTSRQSRSHQRLGSSHSTVRFLFPGHRSATEDDVRRARRGHARGPSIVKTETVVEVTEESAYVPVPGPIPALVRDPGSCGERTPTPTRRMSDGNVKRRISLDGEGQGAGER